jgi:hypothetical protein
MEIKQIAPHHHGLLMQSRKPPNPQHSQHLCNLWRGLITVKTESPELLDGMAMVRSTTPHPHSQHPARTGWWTHAVKTMAIATSQHHSHPCQMQLPIAAKTPIIGRAGMSAGKQCCKY